MKRIKAVLLIISTFFLTMCNYSDKSIVIFPDSTNYQYEKMIGDNILVKRFFPNSKTINTLYIYNKNERIVIGKKFIFNNSGKVIQTVVYKDKMRVQEIVDYYPNGIIERKWTLIDSIVNGPMFHYDTLGRLINKGNFITILGKEFPNSMIYYLNNGDIDSSRSIDLFLKTEKDTISLSDSLEVEIAGICPHNYIISSMLADMDENFIVRDPKTKVELESSKFYFHPYNEGINYIRIYSNIYIGPDIDKSKFYLNFLEKKIFVIDKK